MENTELQELIGEVDLKYSIEQLAKLRKQADEALAIVEAAELKFNEENKDILESLEAINKEEKRMTALVKEIAVQTYQDCPTSKQIADGVGIRVTTKYDYSETTAIDWARVNAPIFIEQVLDKKAFENACKTSKPDFVEILETPIATISTDLSSYLEGE